MLISRTLSFFRIPELSLLLSPGAPRIFLYHGVSPDVPDYGIFNYRKKFVTPELFRQELLWLSRYFTILPLPLLIERMARREVLPPRAAALTFDDGYRNFYRYAFPILQELSLPATMFLATDLVDGASPLWVDTLEYAIGHAKESAIRIPLRGKEKIFPLSTPKERIQTDLALRDYAKKLPEQEKSALINMIVERTGKDLSQSFRSSPYAGMTWDEAREMEQKGVTFASHTLSHPILTRIPLLDMEKEITASKRRLDDELDHPLPVFAYPNGQEGDFSPYMESILRNAGVQAALTTIPGTLPQKANLYAIPRITLDGTDSFAMCKNTASGITHALRPLAHAFKK